MEEHRRGLAELLLEGELGAVTLGLEQGLFSWDELDLPHNSDGSTLLISACQMGLTTVMRFLLERGADATLCNHNNQTALHVSPPDLQGELLAALESRLCHQGQLSEAAWRGDMSTLQHLLTLTDLVDVNSQNRNGLTPLMLAARDVDLFEGLQDIMPWDYRPAEIVKALLALSASLEVQDQNGYIALHYISHIRSPIKDELLQIILKSQPVPTEVEPQFYFPADCPGNSHSCSPPTLAAVKCAAHEDSNQDKITTLFFQTAMEAKRNSRRGSTQLSKAAGWTSSLPNLRDRNKCWDKLGILRCTSDVPIKTSLIPMPPRLTEKSKNVLESPLVPQLSPLSQSAPSLALLDASVLLQVRANIYNRLSSGDTDIDINGHKGSPPVLCPRTTKHLAPLDRGSRDGPVLSSLQRPRLLKPISILPANSVSRQRRERFSRLSFSRGTRRGSAESASSSCSNESSLDEEEGEEEENSPQDIQKMFSTLKKDPQVYLSSSEHLVNLELTDIAQCVHSNNEDMLISQPKMSREVEAAMSHISVNECEQNGERCSVDLLKKDKVVEIIRSSSTDLDGHTGMGTEIRPAVENEQSSALIDVEHQQLSPENNTMSQPASVEKRQPMKATKSKERKCRPFHTSQSFNILAYRNTNWGTVNTKRNRRNLSISSQVKRKDMNPTDLIRGETTNKLDWPRMPPSTSQKVKDAPSTRRRAQDCPHQVKLSGDKKILNKYQGRELQTARQPKKPGNFGTQRAKSALDSVSYSDMFSQIHQGDKGPAIFEMFATPIYENLRVGSSAERTKQVQPAPQVKRSLNGQRAQKAVEGNRRKQPQKCSYSKSKPRKRRNIQQTRPQNLSQSIDISKDEAVVISGPDENFHIRHHAVLTNEEDKRNANEGSPMLSVIKEVLTNCATGIPINHEQKDLPTLSPSAFPPCLSRQIAQLTSEAHKENRSSEIKDSVVEEFPVQPMINTWTSGRTRSPVYYKFLDEVGEGPVTDDLLRCLAEELISLEEREVETLKPEHTENREIITDQPILKKDPTKVTLSSDKLPCTQTSSVDDTITWTKGEVLGRGAYGTVYCGLTGQGQLIAVKQVVLDISTSETAEKEYNRLEREVDLLKNLHHPNIVGFLGTALTDNIISIFMEYVPGGSIFSVLNRFGPLPEKVFALYTRQILEGVAYLHDNRVIHRDLKGNNIMLMPTGIVKLIDFGCARRLNHLSVSGGHSDLLKSVHGTPYWMAPEVINETGHGRKSDIWSVGCTVFEMATGKPPLAHMGKIAALFYIGARKGLMPLLPDDFSEEAKGFVKACLTSNQKQRPSAAELLRHPFISHHRQPKSNKPCSNPHHLSNQTN
ncbi:mitogen-activated protein kinase kinase kinase 19 [Colossoma macropomum]|uniref:mitogen-activated protein kinase kinase kinase 19 n=1 Tax=Colossoma macropomum TaxID=42526 RepID=UPI0018642F22|nr:mitogen-activated protein kinase kinase kinase 19 [Colossoma macropomum]